MGLEEKSKVSFGEDEYGCISILLAGGVKEALRGRRRESG